MDRAIKSLQFPFLFYIHQNTCVIQVNMTLFFNTYGPDKQRFFHLVLLHAAHSTHARCLGLSVAKVTSHHGVAGVLRPDRRCE